MLLQGSSPLQSRSMKDLHCAAPIILMRIMLKENKEGTKLVIAVNTADCAQSMTLTINCACNVVELEVWATHFWGPFFSRYPAVDQHRICESANRQFTRWQLPSLPLHSKQPFPAVLEPGSLCIQ